MKRLSCYMLLMGLLFGVLCACSEDDGSDGTTYPSIITEMAILRVNASMQATIQTDDGSLYRVTNQLEGVKANIMGRMLCGYLPKGNNEVEIYTLQGVLLLRDVTKKITTPVYDPVGIVSQWKSGSFINLHLSPKTQSEPFNQVWGFIRTGSRINEAGGMTHELSLYHYQNNDPVAYSSDFYMSLSLDSVSKPNPFPDKDSIELTVQGFDGLRKWKYGK